MGHITCLKISQEWLHADFSLQWEISWVSNIRPCYRGSTNDCVVNFTWHLENKYCEVFVLATVSLACGIQVSTVQKASWEALKLSLYRHFFLYSAYIKKKDSVHSRAWWQRLLSLLKIQRIYVCVCVCIIFVHVLAYIHVYHVHAVPLEARRYWISGTGVTGCCELLCGYWGPTWVSLWT